MRGKEPSNPNGSLEGALEEMDKAVKSGDYYGADGKPYSDLPKSTFLQDLAKIPRFTVGVALLFLTAGKINRFKSRQN